MEVKERKLSLLLCSDQPSFRRRQRRPSGSPIMIILSLAPAAFPVFLAQPHQLPQKQEGISYYEQPPQGISSGGKTALASRITVLLVIFSTLPWLDISETFTASQPPPPLPPVLHLVPPTPPRFFHQTCSSTSPLSSTSWILTTRALSPEKISLPFVRS